MTEIYDITVIGLGAMGSSSFYHAAKAGKKVLGIEQYQLAHNKGSSHGETRIIREAYHEGTFYVRMSQKSAELWKQLEKESGNKLYDRIGCLMVGKDDSRIVLDSKLSADKYNLPYKMYNRDTIKQRVPGWTLPEGYNALFDESAGLVYPERCIQSHIDVGTQINKQAKAIFDTKVQSYKVRSEDGLIEIITDKGKFLSKQIIISAGIWVNDFLKELNLPLIIQKQSVTWFDNNEDDKKIGKLPCFLVEYDAELQVYGFPNALGTGVKVGLHQQGPIYQNSSQVDYEKDNNQFEKIRNTIAPFLPSVSKCEFSKTSTCFYTRTPDDHFIIDFHPKNKNIVILSPCSGHGFKFSSVIGQMAIELLESKTNPHTHFKIERFTPQSKL